MDNNNPFYIISQLTPKVGEMQEELKDTLISHVSPIKNKIWNNQE